MGFNHFSVAVLKGHIKLELIFIMKNKRKKSDEKQRPKERERERERMRDSLMSGFLVLGDS